MDMDYYKVLGVPRTASPTLIKQRYRVLSKRHHPDLNGDVTVMAQINTAYDTLSSANKRSMYNLSLRQNETTPAASKQPSKRPTNSPATRAGSHGNQSPPGVRRQKKSHTSAWAFTYVFAICLMLIATGFLAVMLHQTPRSTAIAEPTQITANPQQQATNDVSSTESTDTTNQSPTNSISGDNLTATNDSTSDSTQNNTNNTYGGVVCNDGTTSYSRHAYSKCAHHGGVSDPSSQATSTTN